MNRGTARAVEVSTLDGSQKLKVGGNLTSSSLLSISPLDDIAAHVDGAFVIVVKTTAGKYRRRCFLSVAAAQRAADRATERGENATIFLAELKPLWKVQGGTA